MAHVERHRSHGEQGDSRAGDESREEDRQLVPPQRRPHDARPERDERTHPPVHHAEHLWHVAAEREPQPERAARLLPQPAPDEVVAREPSGLRLPEVALVEGGRGVEDLEQPPAAAALLLGVRRGLLVLEPDV